MSSIRLFSMRTVATPVTVCLIFSGTLLVADDFSLYAPDGITSLNVGDFRPQMFESAEEIQQSIPAMRELWLQSPAVYEAAFSNAFYALKGMCPVGLRATKSGIACEPIPEFYKTVCVSLLDELLSLPENLDDKNYEANLELRIKLFNTCFDEGRELLSLDALMLVAGYVGIIQQRIRDIEKPNLKSSVLPPSVVQKLRDRIRDEKASRKKRAQECLWYDVSAPPQDLSYSNPDIYLRLQHRLLYLLYTGGVWRNNLMPLVGHLPEKEMLAHLQEFARVAKLSKAQIKADTKPVTEYAKDLWKLRNTYYFMTASRRRAEEEWMKNPPHIEYPHQSGEIGSGYPGKILPYKTTSQLAKEMNPYGLEAFWFVRDPFISTGGMPPHNTKVNRLPFLLFTPEPSDTPAPLLVYIAGTGEMGTDLIRHFRQSTVFKKVTAPEFQAKHPCYIFAPMMPEFEDIGSTFFGFSASGRRFPDGFANYVCDAMYAAIREAKGPTVDLDRLYITGLSAGGHSAMATSLAFPGRFAACVPISTDCITGWNKIPKRNPGRYWALYNEHDRAGPTIRENLNRYYKTVIEAAGGEMRITSYPDSGHDAWTRAWSDDAVWEWLFSKSNSTVPAHNPETPSLKPISLESVKKQLQQPGTNHSMKAMLFDAHRNFAWRDATDPGLKGD